MGIVRTCERTWRLIGVPRDVRAQMADDLEADLAEAEAAGIPPDRYLAGDPRELALAWARERGVLRPRLRPVSVALAALVGAIPGAVFALFAAYGLSSQAAAEILGGELVRVGPSMYEPVLDPPGWLILGLYTLGAFFAYAGVLAAVRAVLARRLDPALASTVRLLSWALLFAIPLAIVVTIIFSWSQGFSTAAPVLAGDGVVAASVLAASVAGVRVAAVRGRPPVVRDPAWGGS